MSYDLSVVHGGCDKYFQSAALCFEYDLSHGIPLPVIIYYSAFRVKTLAQNRRDFSTVKRLDATVSKSYT